MSKLANESCEACRVGAPTLTPNELQQFMVEIPEWEIINQEKIPQLTRQFKFSNFVDAMAFANKVGELAEQYDHHPAITVEWGKVCVLWWTHKIKGLHRNDVIMAAKTDGLFMS